MNVEDFEFINFNNHKLEIQKYKEKIFELEKNTELLEKNDEVLQIRNRNLIKDMLVLKFKNKNLINNLKELEQKIKVYEEQEILTKQEIIIEYCFDCHNCQCICNNNLPKHKKD